ncbi:hypothetical protein CA13_38420 [Planctomycetes bacterium CA13]|uniref:STAS domain-containing protein n=1 Tax=Novipirellula herctigrandis TaxID=2527986 RepID=A0A5C5Z4R4_9BACT|nr:hypothetical protein CA13_38420 [Planctomycetes bacterium CA13]
MIAGIDGGNKALGMRTKPGDWIASVKTKIEHSDQAEVVIDLSGVTVIDSHDLGELIRMQLSAKQLGRRLVLKDPQADVLKIMTLTRLDRLIELRHPGLSTAKEPPSLPNRG